MAINIITKKEQADGAFNGGAILEKKPIGFPQDGGKQKPYSNIFYWAHAWSDQGSTIGEHPHQGFEIMSFVLKGKIEHYDNKHKDWKPLIEGDAQLIQAGNGITHAEKMHAGSAMFQIWLDPNLSKTLEKPADYSDFKRDKFPIINNNNGIQTKIFIGEGSPMHVDTEKVEIKQLEIKPGKHKLNNESNKVLSAFLIEGQLNINGLPMSSGDFVIIKEAIDIEIDVISLSKLFIISSPLNTSYRTYASRQGWN